MTAHTRVSLPLSSKSKTSTRPLRCPLPQLAVAARARDPDALDQEDNEEANQEPPSLFWRCFAALCYLVRPPWARGPARPRSCFVPPRPPAACDTSATRPPARLPCSTLCSCSCPPGPNSSPRGVDLHSERPCVPARLSHPPGRCPGSTPSRWAAPSTRASATSCCSTLPPVGAAPLRRACVCARVRVRAGLPIV